MQKGWSAKGLLRPLWQDYPGKRDGLAAAAETSGSVLSSLNSGQRPLGPTLGKRLAAELGVTLAELGAPLDADEASQTLSARLESLAAEAEAGRRLLSEGLAAIDDRLSRIERALRLPAQKGRGSAAPS